MRVMAFRRISVLQATGAADPKSYIDAGDLCELGPRTLSGLWPVTYPTSRGPKTRWLRELRGFLVNQNDYASIPYPAPGYEQATVKSGGCGVCAAVNALGALLGVRVPVATMAQFSRAWGARVPRGTDMRRLTDKLEIAYRVICRQTSSAAELRAHLASGGVAICNTAGRGLFSTGGHYMAILGELDGKLCIADSGLYAGKYSSAARRKKVSVSGDLIFAAVSDLDTDCVGRSPRYYLLSRQG